MAIIARREALRIVGGERLQVVQQRRLAVSVRAHEMRPRLP